MGGQLVENEKLFELYAHGFNTLKALCIELRLEKEWNNQIKQQYYGALVKSWLVECDNETSRSNIDADPEDTIKLLVRCRKMYEAKTSILQLLKLNQERTQMIEYVNIRIRISD